MFSRIKELFILISIFLLPAFVFAGPSVSWSQSPTVNNGVLTGYISVSGIDNQTPDLGLLLFTDSNADFNPFLSYALIAPASNNTFNFTMPFDGTVTHLLPVLDENISPPNSFNPFTAYSPGQMASIGDLSSDDTDPDLSSDDEDPDLSSTPVITFQPSSQINNPLGVDLDIVEFIGQLFENFVKVALPFLVLFVIWAGLQFVLARGNEEKLSDAKKNLLYVIIGVAIVFGAWGIANLLSGTVDQFEAANFVMKLLV